MNELQITNLKNKRVLVTGGGGFLGKAIINHLIAYTPFIRSLSRKYYPELDKLKVQQVRGDLANADAVNQACQDQDIVFHVAAKAGFWGPYMEYYQTNVTGTYNIINACISHKVGYLIYTSSPGVVNGCKGSIEGVDESAPYPANLPTAARSGSSPSCSASTLASSSPFADLPSEITFVSISSAPPPTV